VDSESDADEPVADEPVLEEPVVLLVFVVLVSVDEILEEYLGNHLNNAIKAGSKSHYFGVISAHLVVLELTCGGGSGGFSSISFSEIN